MFATWALHDVEEALTFPSTSDELAQVTGIESLRIDGRQAWTAVGIMGVFVATACFLGQKTEGRSRLYRAVLAGLEGHVYTHLVASAARRGYTAGVATAVPVMLPGAVTARRELRRTGAPLTDSRLHSRSNSAYSCSSHQPRAGKTHSDEPPSIAHSLSACAGTSNKSNLSVRRTGPERSRPRTAGTLLPAPVRVQRVRKYAYDNSF